MAPLWAIPFALFFQITTGRPFSDLPVFYLVSLVFGWFSMFGVWIARHWLVPPLVAREPDGPRLSLQISLLHTAVALLFGVAGALVLHFTIMPGFLGSGRAVLTLLTYFVLFGMMFLGASLAFRFYQRAMERAGSDRELQLARRIQQSFLPSVFPARRRFDVHATNVASKEVSGDFYDVVPVGDDGYLLAVADVSGKGVPAALLSSMLQASLRTQAPSGIRLAAMMESVNALVCQRVATGQFATFFLAAASERDMTLRFTNAGHNYPILFQARGGRRTLETGGLVVGMMEPVAYDEGTVALEPGDRLIIYSDGVTEAARADGEMFGEERLVTLVESLPAGLAARELVERVLAGLRAFLGEAEAGDDITLMALRVLPERKVATPS
jgi:hypothetical protein